MILRSFFSQRFSKAEAVLHFTYPGGYFNVNIHTTVASKTAV